MTTVQDLCTCGHVPSIAVTAGGLPVIVIRRSKFTDCDGFDESDIVTVKASVIRMVLVPSTGTPLYWTLQSGSRTNSTGMMPLVTVQLIGAVPPPGLIGALPAWPSAKAGRPGEATKSTPGPRLMLAGCWAI